MYAGGAILALDSATRTGVCCGIPGETPQLEVVNFGKGGGDEFELWARAQVWLIRRINGAAQAGTPIQQIVIEGLVPQYDKTIQCGIYAVFGSVARNKGIPIKSVAIQTWRAFVLGSGKLNKVTAKARAINITTQLGWNPKGHDAAEAACLWLWGCSQVAPRRAHNFAPLFLGRAS